MIDRKPHTFDIDLIMITVKSGMIDHVAKKSGDLGRYNESTAATL